MKVAVVENVLKLNDQVAGMNREALRKAGVFALDLMGAPGCGKTALLEATLRALEGKLRCAVIVGDLTTQRDADRMAKWCDQVVQVNTGKGCHLEAHHVAEALGKVNLAKVDVLFIENVGNLICPVGFDLGQNRKVGMFAVSGGDDKAAKHPYIVCEAALLILSKIDLLPHVSFDLQLFRSDIRRLNPKVRLLETSVVTCAGLDQWVLWIKENVMATKKAAAKKPAKKSCKSCCKK